MSGRREGGVPRATGMPTRGRKVSGHQTGAESLPGPRAASESTGDPLWQRVYVAVCGLLLLGCAAGIASLALAGWQGRDSRFEDPLSLLGMAAATVLLAGAGLWALLPTTLLAHRRVGAGFGIALCTAVVTVLLAIGIACLVTPETMISESGRGPRTDGQARAGGAVLLAVAAVLVTSALRAINSRIKHT